MWDYTNKVREHFLNPRNVGEIEKADAVGEIGNIKCGDALRLTLKIDNKGLIVDAKFKTFGCASAIASSSALTEMIKGKTLDEALQVTNKDIAAYLGGLPEEKMHCSVMGQEALEKAISAYRGIVYVEHEHDHEGKVVCTCFNVTDTKIRRVVMENNLTTVDEVTHYCKAGGACGSCKGDIEKLIADVRRVKQEKEEERTGMMAAKKPLTNLEKIRLIQDVIDKNIRPWLSHDGGDLELIDIIGNEVHVKLRGSCCSCPAAGQTLKHYVEKTLRDQVTPELRVIEVKA